MIFVLFAPFLFIHSALALPERYVELLPFVQAAPNQADSNTCLYVSSTGAMELLLNKINNVQNPEPNGPYDLSESFVIFQPTYRDRATKVKHFMQEVVGRFNWGVAVHQNDWPYRALNEDGTTNMDVINVKHPQFETLPRIKVPQIKSQLLFKRGWTKYAHEVLRPSDIEAVKKALVEKQGPVHINVNDDGYWHILLIVGYDDTIKGDCYQIDERNCNKTGAFFVRDSYVKDPYVQAPHAKRYQARAYNWFLEKGNSAAVIMLK